MIAANVFGELVPAQLVRPFFDEARIDLAFVSDIKKIDQHYASMGAGRYFLAPTPAHIDAVYAAGLRSTSSAPIWIEAPDEPNESFPGRTAYTPDAYITLLKQMQARCRRYGYKLKGFGLSNWLREDSLTWGLAAINRDVEDYCDELVSHCYGVRSNGDMQRVIDRNKAIWRKPWSFTEFCLKEEDLLPIEEYGGPWSWISPRGMVWGSIIKCCLDNGVRSCVFSLPYMPAQPSESLIGPDGMPTTLYREIVSVARPGMALAV